MEARVVAEGDKKSCGVPRRSVSDEILRAARMGLVRYYEMSWEMFRTVMKNDSPASQEFTAACHRKREGAHGGSGPARKKGAVAEREFPEIELNETVTRQLNSASLPTNEYHTGDVPCSNTIAVAAQARTRITADSVTC